VRRVHAELVTLGHTVSPKRVWRFMRRAGLQGRHPRPWKRTTITEGIRSISSGVTTKVNHNPQWTVTTTSRDLTKYY
jgi:HTH-like domain